MAAITIQDIRVGNQFRGETVKHLLGNVGEKVTIEIDFKLLPVAISTLAKTITFGQPGQPTLDFIFDSSGNNRFAEWTIGDTISVTNAVTPANNGTATIIGKQGNDTIQLDRTYTSQVDGGGARIDNTTVVNGIVLKTAFIENNEGTNFESKETLEQQVWRFDGIDHTNTSYSSLVPDLNPDWQLGTIQIKGQNVGGEVSYTLRWETSIHPFFLDGQLADLQADIAPDYFLSNNTLKHVFEIGLRPDLSDPNRQFTLIKDDALGNVGWLDENFDGNPNNYSIDSIVYTKVSDVSTVNELILDAVETTQVDITVKNTIDSPFSAANSQAAVTFAFLPQDRNQYVNTGNVLQNNFLYDTAFNTEGAAQVNGDQFGTGTQIITAFDVTFVAADEITLSFIVDLGADAFSKLLASDDRFYYILANVQNHTLATAVADKVQLKADVNEFSYVLGDDTTLTYSNKYLIHPINDLDGIQIESTFLPEDIIVSSTLLTFARPDAELSSITEIRGSLIAKKTDGSEFVLESFTLPFTGLSDVNGGQYIDFAQSRQFKVPSDEIRSEIVVKRRLDLDSGTDFVYQFAYPWSFRWEDWVVLAGVNSDFFDALELNDGYNNEWNRYNVPAAWSVNWRVETDINIRDNNTQAFQNFTVEQDFSAKSRDYDESSDWQTVDINTFDSDTLDPLTGDLILGYKDTLVEAELEYTGAGADPALGSIWAVLNIEVYQEGGRFDNYRFSNIYAVPTTGATWWKSTDSSNLIVMSNPSAGVYRASALIDFTKLPANKFTFKISYRIGIITDPTCLTTESGTDIDLESGLDCIAIEN